MEVFREFKDYNGTEPLALSLGMFDGVHKGHQSILQEINRIAEQKGLKSSILTFWPHPRLVFNPDAGLKLLNTLDEKTELLGKFGIQLLFLKNFDEEFRNMYGADFIKEILAGKLHVRYLIIGHDHVFGKNRSGNFKLLQEMGPEYGFEAEQMEVVNLHNNNISSTKIRNALSEGRIEDANEMLGYHYPVSGTVIHGAKIGRTLGFPTANILTDPQKLLPKKGAYIVDVVLGGQKYQGMLSVGTNPTVDGTSLSVEVHILDFDKDIYGQPITVQFRKFLHDEIKFQNLGKLIERLEEDRTLTRRFFVAN